MRSFVVALLVPHLAQAIPPGLKSSEPVTCEGSEEIVVSKIYIETKGDGITVAGQCKVTITGSQIVAKGYAISAAGQAEVTVRDSVLEGGKSAFNIDDQATVHSQGNKITGGILVMGQGNYDDQGGNQNERSAEEPSAVVSGGDEDQDDEEEDEPEAAEGDSDEEDPDAEDESAAPSTATEPAVAKTVLPRKLRKSKPVVCRKNVKAITLKKRVIHAKKDGVVIYGNCAVTVEQSLIKSGRWAISHQGKGKLVIKDSIIEGRKGALQLFFEDADVTVTGSTIKGKIDKKAGAELKDEGGNTFAD